jgi:hypothetical protein
MNDQQGTPDQPPPAEPLVRLITAFRPARAVQVVAKLGIADLLKNGARDVADLAAATGTDSDALGRLLRCLAGFGVFASDQDGRFRLTPLSDCLRSDAPGGSLRAYAILLGSEESWQSWGGLEHSIRTGQPAFEQAFGEPFFDYFSTHPDAALVFDDAMSSRSREEAAAFVATFDLSAANMIVDVGGGHGTLLAAVLRANPRAGGVLVDDIGFQDLTCRCRHHQVVGIADQADAAVCTTAVVRSDVSTLLVLGPKEPFHTVERHIRQQR